MRQVTLYILDESKANSMIQFLQELDFLEVQETEVTAPPIKKFTTIPKSVLHPIKVPTFQKFSREELHER
jgi:hypothetical protein